MYTISQTSGTGRGNRIGVSDGAAIRVRRKPRENVKKTKNISKRKSSTLLNAPEAVKEGRKNNQQIWRHGRDW